MSDEISEAREPYLIFESACRDLGDYSTLLGAVRAAYLGPAAEV